MEINGGNEAILIADDETTIRLMASQFLEKIGYKVYVTADGPTTLDKVRELSERLDLLILDMNMPGMSGIEAYHMAKALSPELKIILSTGYDVEDEIRKALEARGDDILPKPYRVTQLATVIRQVLSNN